MKEAALYVVGQFEWPSEARHKHSREVIEAIGTALASKTADVRTAALYVMNPTLVDEQLELAGAPLIFPAADVVDAALVAAVITMGTTQKTDATIVATLRKTFSDPAMQERRQSAYSLANFARSSKAAIPELFKAMRDEHAECYSARDHSSSQNQLHVVKAAVPLGSGNET